MNLKGNNLAVTGAARTSESDRESQGLGFHGKAARMLAVLCGLSLLAVPGRMAAASIVNSKHDLSVAGPGPVKAVSESEICIFCHTPHRSTSETPLWNHTLSQATYIPYDSTTLKTVVGQPTGSSKLCLSCHDGTVALGMVNSRDRPIALQGGVVTMPSGRSLIGTDLSDDHPVSFHYDGSLVAANGQLKDPSWLNDRVRVDGNGQMQCTSCHDPHDNQFGKFLVQDNYGSALCVTCHEITDWRLSAHRTSNRSWNGTGLDPWPNTDETTVAGNACASCHATHGAGTRQRLLTYAEEEQNCFSCHDGSVATKNLQNEFTKISVHPILRTSHVHDPTEDLVNPPRHVECVDCHNPHAARRGGANPPNASGALAGVAGINSVGTLADPVQAEYELCYRCHADSVNRGPAHVTRHTVQTNTRLEFDQNNLSYHPVEASGKNPNVPSLIPPWTPSSFMFCTDCHNNNQAPGTGAGAGPNGPHGSIYTPLLERQLLLSDNSSENFAVYALCYKCHNRASILSNRSFKGHREHVVEERTACTTCHDPHGVETSTHLINFNTLYVTPSSSGRLEFIDTGNFSGMCFLTCHGEDHNPERYPD